MGALRVYAIDENMNRCTGDIPYRSLDWHRCYYECGDFTLEVPVSVYDPSWAYICTDERPETGIIQKVEYSDTAQVAGGDDTVTLSGFFLESLLNRMTFLVEEPEEMTYAVEPRSPYVLKSQVPKIYVNNETGGLAYKNSSGDFVDQDGNQMDIVVGYEETQTTVYGGTSFGESLASVYASKLNGVEGTITTTSWDGTRETFDVLMYDDKGNAYIKANNRIQVVMGIASADEDGYTTAVPYWDKGIGKYETVRVKGPWQRTDTEEPITAGDTVQIVFKWIQRFCGNSFTYIEPTFSGVERAVDPSLQLLGDLAYATLKESGASFRVMYNFVGNKMTLQVYRGLDRTQDQSGNPWCVFSDTWGTLKGFSASRDTSNYRNTCYVLYEYDEPEWDGNYPKVVERTEWNGHTFTLLGYYIPYTTRRGYVVARTGGDDEPAIETYLDLRSDKPSADSLWSRDDYDEKPSLPSLKGIYDSYQSSLIDQGKAMLLDKYGDVTCLDTGDLSSSRYPVDYDLGDLVDMSVDSLGIKATARITEIDEVYAASGDSVRQDISIKIGDRQLSFSEKSRMV